MRNNFCGGLYRVGPQAYASKIVALRDATRQKITCRWDFNDDQWEEASRLIKPFGHDLRRLYRERARQLRDCYDYLILSYSGGSDSWTALRAFLEQNLLVDEIVVNWPIKLTQGVNALHPYVADPFNKHPSNYLSEWDLVIRQDLDELRKISPKTKITINDWSEAILKPDPNELYAVPHFHDLIQMKMISTSLLDRPKLLDKGMKVGYIYGVDKVNIWKFNTGCFFNFCDGSTRINHDGVSTFGTEVEYFYWTLDMPQLVLAQAYAMFDYFKEHPELVECIDYGVQGPQRLLNWRIYSQLAKKLARPDYELDRFQSDGSPQQSIHHTKHRWVQGLSVFRPAYEQWNSVLNSHFSEISGEYQVVEDGLNRGLRSMTSRLIKIGDFATV